MNPPPKTIVMVDDEKPYVDLLAQMLTLNLGCSVAAFTEPRDALAALPQLEVGVVVTDYYMPRMDGFEFIRAAAPLLPGIPFIVISGHSIELPDSLLAPAGPLRSLLPKPFGWRRLAEEIARYAPAYAPLLARAGATSAPF